MAGRRLTKNDLITRLSVKYPKFNEEYGIDSGTLSYSHLSRIINGEPAGEVLGKKIPAIYERIKEMHGETLKILYPRVKLQRLDNDTLEKLAAAESVEAVLGPSKENSFEAIRYKIMLKDNPTIKKMFQIRKGNKGLNESSIVHNGRVYRGKIGGG